MRSGPVKTSRTATVSADSKKTPAPAAAVASTRITATDRTCVRLSRNSATKMAARTMSIATSSSHGSVRSTIGPDGRPTSR
ncbi:hypothetical protein GCM10027176_10710 [Actinoallomurus bryophytorum]